MKTKDLKISIIIPVLNEENCISTIVSFLEKNYNPSTIKEILVVDGGSSDATLKIASQYKISVLKSPKGRAKQLNYGAKKAQGDILYFLHVDTTPPKNFDLSILNAVNKGCKTGCFRMKFDSPSLFLAFFAWFTRFNFKICRGGDQSLFITKKQFQKTGGFNEDYLVYEDNEFTNRLYNTVGFTIIPKHVITSSRRYKERGALVLQFHFAIIHLKHFLGAEPCELYEYYSRKIS